MRKYSRLIQITLVLFLVIGLSLALGNTGQAQETPLIPVRDYTLYFHDDGSVTKGADGADVTATDVPGWTFEEGLYREHDSWILTLTGLNFVTSADTAMRVPDDTVIIITDGSVNRVESTNTGGTGTDYCGIFGVSELIITGGSANSGQLTVLGGGYGIYCIQEFLISGGNIEASGSDAAVYGHSTLTLGEEGNIPTLAGTNDQPDQYGYVSSKKLTQSGSDPVTISFGALPEVHKHDVSVACAGDGEEVEFESLNAKVLADGYTLNADDSYYLTADLPLSQSLRITGENTVVNLCLNGYQLNVATSDEISNSFGGIEIDTGAKLNICDCKGGLPEDGHEIDDPATELSTDKVTIETGLITGATANDAIKAYGDLYLYGGTIAGNSSTNKGPVYIHTTGGLHMFGGEISHNFGKTAGGVESYGYFAMSGGRIINNYSNVGPGSRPVGGVSIFQNEFHISGDPVIKDNTAGTGRIASNVAIIRNSSVSRESYITVDDDLTSGARLGVTIFDWNNNASLDGYFAQPDGSYSGGISGTDMGKFFSDSGYMVSQETADGDYKGWLKLGDHEHPICGASCGHTPGHTDTPTFTSLNAKVLADDYTLDENGSYYLTADLPLDESLYIAGGAVVNLCLNGHKLTTPASGPAIWIYGGATLNICDCKGGLPENGHEIDDPAAELQTDKVTIETGLITGADYAAIWVGGELGAETSSPGTVNFYGGTIAGNNGMGVGVGSTAVFNMYDGAISHNFGLIGGVVGERGSFAMSGGTISHNMGEIAGGVLVEGGDFTMTGGAISDNMGITVGGVFFGSGSFDLSGDSVISGNTLMDGEKAEEGAYVSTGQNSNLALFNRTEEGTEISSIITVSDALGENASIGVTLVESITEDNPPIITTVPGYFAQPDGVTITTLDGYAGKFFSDSGYPVELETEVADKIGWLKLGPHSHPICGGECAHAAVDSGGEPTFEHQAVTFQPLTQAQLVGSNYTISGEGNNNYFLTADLALDESLVVTGAATEVNLCLNGHKLTAPKRAPAIVTQGGATLNICDCNGSGGRHEVFDPLATMIKIQNDPDADPVTVPIEGGLITSADDAAILVGESSSSSSPGTVNFYGGTIAGNNLAGVGVGPGAVFNMYGGAISYTFQGNAVSTQGAGAVFNMYGGQIHHNGGMCSVEVGSGSSFAMSGGEISDNFGAMGGVFVAGGSFAMSGGEISRNMGEMVGGVLVWGGGFTMSGGEISRNMGAAGGGVLFVGGSFDLSGEPVIRGNTLLDIEKAEEEGVFVSTGQRSNVALVNGTFMGPETKSIITVSGALTGADASIGVTLVKDITSAGGDDDPLIITIGAGYFAEPGGSYIITNGVSDTTKNDMAKFFSDYSDYMIEQEAEFAADEYGWLKLTQLPHEHSLDCDPEAKPEDIIDFQPLTQAMVAEPGFRINASGSYYLTADLPLSNTLVIGNTDAPITVNLCLNGHKLTAPAYGPAIVTYEGATLNICDCDGHKGEHEILNTATRTNTTDEVTIKGGLITGAKSKAAILVGDSDLGSGTVNFYGGTIAGNDITYRGDGPVVLNDSSFNMHGGQICYNYGDFAGGVSVFDGSFFTEAEEPSTGSKFNMFGGSIHDNQGTASGGVCVFRSSFTMSGGTISGNSGDDTGGVLVIVDSSFTMSGDAAISGNEGTNSGGVLVDEDSSFTMSGGAAISGNYGGDAGGVFVDDSSFTMSGTAAISGNIGLEMGGVFVAEGSFFMSGDAAVSDNIGLEMGGVFIEDGVFTMSGGAVYDNLGMLGGVVFYKDDSFTVSGDSVISGNEYFDWESLEELFDTYPSEEAFLADFFAGDVTIPSSGFRNVTLIFDEDVDDTYRTYITVGGPLTEGANIGVTVLEWVEDDENGDYVSVPGPFAKPGSDSIDLAGYTDYFRSDSDYDIRQVTSGEFAGWLELYEGGGDQPDPPPTPPGPGGSGVSGGSGGLSVTIPVSSGENSVQVNAILSGSAAKVSVTDQQLDKVISGNDVGLVSVDISKLDKATSVQLPAKLLKAIAGNKSATGLEVILPAGSIVFDKDATATLADNAGSSGITIEIKKAGNLTPAQKAAAGDNPVYEIIARGKNGIIHDLGGWATITLPYDGVAEDGSLVQIFYIDAEGNLQQVYAVYDAKTNTVSFRVNHLSLFVIKYAANLAGWVNPYTDVAKGNWFYAYVRDLTIAGVVNGYPDSTFRPGGAVTYGEALKLIMKAVGYADQAPSAKHWASGYMDKALADGLIGAAFIDLDAPIDRLYVAEIAARALKLDVADIPASTPFVDCDSNAALALYKAGIVEGSFNPAGQRLYKPNDNINRAEITTIIWRINKAVD